MNDVDARGKSCPLPIVLLAKAVKSAGLGETVAIQADDRAFPPDVEAWCQRTGNELVSLDRNDRGYFDAVIRRLS
jgi:tRNA 2-thiouridine synthesizing protein A